MVNLLIGNKMEDFCFVSVQVRGVSLATSKKDKMAGYVASTVKIIVPRRLVLVSFRLPQTSNFESNGKE